MHARRLVRIGLLLSRGACSGRPQRRKRLGSGSGVEPASYSATVPVGGSVTVTKTVHTPAIPPLPDVYFLSDTTGEHGRARSRTCRRTPTRS